MRTGNFWWLAAVVAAHDGGRVQGRTRLQKTVKLLQRLGLPTDYRYTIFFYGPYSEAVFADSRLLQQMGLLTEQERVNGEGTPSFELTASPEAAVEAMGRWRPALEAMQAADLVVLELAATYDAFREMGSGHEDAVVRLRQKKASRWTEERHARAMELLRRLGLPGA